MEPKVNMKVISLEDADLPPLEGGNSRKNLLLGKFSPKVSIALWGWDCGCKTVFEHSDCNDDLLFLLAVGDALSRQPEDEVWIRHGMLFVKKSAVMKLERRLLVNRAGENWRCLLHDGVEIGYFAADNRVKMEAAAWWWNEMFMR